MKQNEIKQVKIALSLAAILCCMSSSSINPTLEVSIVLIAIVVLVYNFISLINNRK